MSDLKNSAELERLHSRITALEEALEWYVENDDTNEGDEPLSHLGGATWNDVNAFWLEGRNKARALLEEK